MRDLQQQFDDWLEGRLDDAQARHLHQQLLQHEPELAEMMENMGELQQHADAYVETDVPAWNREVTFQQHYVQRTEPVLNKWFSFWLPAGSMAFSVLALALVLLNVQVSTTAEGWQLAFGGGGNELTPQAMQQQIDQAVDARLAKFEDSQDAKLQQYASNLKHDFTESLKTSTTQLASYVLATSRQERREDFSDFIKYVNNQREDDQVFYANLIRQFQEDVADQTSYRSQVPASQLTPKE